MFGRIFATRFKCLVRDRSTMFWTMMFPILLATMFYFAFSGLDRAYEFTKFDIAVVNNEQFKNDTTFQNALDEVSGKSDDPDTQVLFNVTYCDKDKAEQLLKDSEIEGYIDYDGEPKIVVKDTGLDQTILKAFVDEYLQTVHAAGVIIRNNPQSAATISFDTSDRDFLKETPLTQSKPNLTLIYFYSLVALACFYGGLAGLKEVTAVQANQSAQGARVNLAPVNKLKVFLASMCAATVVQIICVYVLIAFLILVLKIDFGTKIPFVLLACLVSSFTGVSFGAFIGAVIKAGEDLKVAILTSVTMVLTFLSGMMVVEMKYIVEKNAPIVAKLNPVNIVTDTFYSLYYYDTYTQYIKDILALVCFSAVFYICVYLVMRRQRYESI